VARDKGVLTVGVVTKPFLFEGTRRMRSADRYRGAAEARRYADRHSEPEPVPDRQG
jgi:cell division protein FtsZ